MHYSKEEGVVYTFEEGVIKSPDDGQGIIFFVKRPPLSERILGEWTIDRFEAGQLGSLPASEFSTEAHLVFTENDVTITRDGGAPNTLNWEAIDPDKILIYGYDKSIGMLYTCVNDFIHYLNENGEGYVYKKVISPKQQV